MIKKTAQEWIDAARLALIEEGVTGLKVDRLAERLGVSRSSFYHYFAGQPLFLGRFLEHWEARCRFVPAGDPPADAGAALAWLDALTRELIDSDGYDHQFDLAVREWARANPQVAARIATADRRRLGALQRFFTAIGYDGDLAEIRARVFYFHQIGYHAIGVLQSAAERSRTAQIYLNILCGEDRLAAARAARPAMRRSAA